MKYCLEIRWERSGFVNYLIIACIVHQWVWAALVKDVLKAISKTLQELHWLPIKWRIDYKAATLTYKLLESGEPTYLRTRFTSKIFRRVLRSSANDRQLEPCSSHTKIGSCAFRCAVRTIWNCPPYDIRAAPSVFIFRSRLKLHYFKLAILTSYFGIKRLWDQLFYAPLIQFDDWFYHLACVLYKF